MAARKLQAEIDRTLKKVAEGVESFQNIYDKMQASTNQTQKEKAETDLKTQIKKLQRLRDQIKSWVASSDIKDKSVLLENRKLIETQMEKFKACEKEMKTKAFSKEGLTQVKLDPKAQERNDTISWLQNMVDELSMQTETAEAEVETLQGGNKKKGKGGGTNERLEHLEHLNERRKWHVGRLELILRLMENGSMPTEKVLDIKEDVQYFVDTNTEDTFEEDEGIYDDLNLEEVEGQFGIGGEGEDSDDDSAEASESIPTRTPAKDTMRKVSAHEENHHKKEEFGSPVLKKGIAARKHSATEVVRPSISANFASQPMASVVKTAPTPARAPTLPPMRYSAAAAAGSSNTQNHTTNDAPHPPSSTAHSPPAATISSAPHSISESLPTSAPVPPSPSLTHPSITMSSPVLSSVDGPSASHVSRMTPPSETRTFDSPEASPVLAEAQPAATSSPHRTHPTRAPPQPDSTTLSPPPGIAQPIRAQINGTQPTPAENLQSTSSTQLPQLQSASSQAQSTTPFTHSSRPQQPIERSRPASRVNAPIQQPQQQQDSMAPRQAGENQSALPSSLSDLLVSFEGAKQKAATRMNDLDSVHKMLEAGIPNIPQPRDTSKPKYYVPRHPHQTPSYYPQTPHPVLSTPSVFSQLDVETLFYVFYYLPGTYQQYLAAKELKKQSWRFHVKYLTWFQRHSEPQAITEEYEQGVYVYFDWEGSWCQRKKSDFRFEYRYLSED